MRELTPTFSVIVNARNAEKYLAEALDSIYAQTRHDWEIILWDNCSEDATAAIARCYDERLRYFRGSLPLTLGAARREAVACARGLFLCFLDSDDAWYPKHLEQHAQVLADPRFAASFGAYDRVDSHGRITKRVHPSRKSGYMFRSLLREFDISLPTAVVRRASVECLSLTFDPSMRALEDYCFFMQLAAEFDLAVVDEPTARYRIHDEALTNRTVERWALERRYTLDLIQRNRPDLANRYQSDFRCAYARAHYYEACGHMASGNRLRATATLLPVAILDVRYAAACVLTLLPKAAWDRVQGVRAGRRFETESSSVFSRDSR